MYVGSTWFGQQGHHTQQGKDLYIKDKPALRSGSILDSIPEGLLTISQVTIGRDSSQRTHGIVIHG